MVFEEQERSPIVVGFDGSEGGLAALEWAADEAIRRGVLLRVVQAWTPGEFGREAEQGQYAQEKLTQTVGAALEGLEVQWEAVAAEGSAAKVLLGHAQNAQMLVVGSRGHGAFAGLVLGSVGIQVATHDGAPVVVIVRRPLK
ncbi:MAG TPA: universal stress protein [Acidimicrobiales bacterium]|nr:universal stress protein [Acidimicrobiales bacterium]